MSSENRSTNLKVMEDKLTCYPSIIYITDTVIVCNSTPWVISKQNSIRDARTQQPGEVVFNNIRYKEVVKPYKHTFRAVSVIGLNDV